MKELHGGVSLADIQLLMDQLVGNAVEVVVDHNVIIDVGLGLRPEGQLEGRGRQGQRPVFLLRFKPTVPRAFELLKRFGIELGQ